MGFQAGHGVDGVVRYMLQMSRKFKVMTKKRFSLKVPDFYFLIAIFKVMTRKKVFTSVVFLANLNSINKWNLLY